ncbi:MAG: hypothetical protein IPK76_02400 [Lewinellaceae bacterium]|nr:hypothetical protein [Lewinellaceae bacterium]
MKRFFYNGIRYESDTQVVNTRTTQWCQVMRGSDDEKLPEYNDGVRPISPLSPLTSTLEEVKFIRQQLIQKNLTLQAFTGFGASERLFKQRAGSLSASALHLG